jgi:putative cardiolipin synthase
MVVDRQRSFIGSMNLDPRSEVFNSEMGVVVDSPPLAANWRGRWSATWGLTTAGRSQATPGGSLQWRSGTGTLAREPARHLWQRVENLLFKLFPPSLY